MYGNFIHNVALWWWKYGTFVLIKGLQLLLQGDIAQSVLSSARIFLIYSVFPNWVLIIPESSTRALAVTSTHLIVKQGETWQEITDFCQ
jgi:hypothetical protein